MGERIRIALVCEDCGARNYRKSKAKKVQAERLSLRKFCPQCNRHTQHRESR